MIMKYVYVFSTRCSPVVNFKTVPYRNLPNSGSVVVTASAVVYVVFWCIPFFRDTVFLRWLVFFYILFM
jgi:hypothetical protein